MEKLNVYVLSLFSIKNLTFEQQKEILMMQMEYEKVIQQKELEADVMKQKQNRKIQQYKLDLIKEGKLAAGDLDDNSTTTGTLVAPQFDIISNLKLLPKFNDKDPDAFFSMFKRLRIKELA